MNFLKCCGKDSVRVSEPKSDDLASNSKYEIAQECAQSKDGRKNSVEKMSLKCSSQRKGGFQKRLRKWIGKWVWKWVWKTKKDKQRKTITEEVLCENEETTASNPNMDAWVNGLNCAEGSEAGLNTEAVPGKESTADNGTESNENYANIEQASEGSAYDDTSEASSSRSALKESESKNWIANLSEKNIEMFMNIYSSTSENTRLRTTYLLTNETEGETDLSMGCMIGKGTFASVQKGKWTVRKSSGEVMTKDLAIKIIKHKNLKQLSFSINELKALTRCKHPNIVELHFIKIYDQTILLGVELASRGDLRDYLEENGPLLEDQSRILFNQIVDAVQYCHVNGIAHLDIKSQNILLDQNMKVKLTDFGLSLVQPNPENITAEQFKTNMGCGTLPYTAPEMFNGNMYDSRKCDVWSLGILLFMMLTSKYPFSICDIEIMVEKLSMEEFAGLNSNYLIKRVYKRPRFPPGLSKPVRGLIVTMLRIKPKYRANISKVQHHYWLPKNGN